MSHFKISSSLIFILLTTIAVNVKAEVFPVTCSWQTTYQNSSASGATVVDACMDNGATAAVRTRNYNRTANTCSISLQSNYNWSGTCENPSITKTIITCAPDKLVRVGVYGGVAACVGKLPGSNQELFISQTFPEQKSMSGAFVTIYKDVDGLTFTCKTSIPFIRWEYVTVPGQCK